MNRYQALYHSAAEALGWDDYGALDLSKRASVIRLTMVARLHHWHISDVLNPGATDGTTIHVSYARRSRRGGTVDAEWRRARDTGFFRFRVAHEYIADGGSRSLRTLGDVESVLRRYNA